ncbi:hypothetical protein BN871_AF_00200 [Paenibacillus sp. P22]|nr:hypothetical protein BN871_AF_00200 [Paenibacillus sp. P22]
MGSDRFGFCAQQLDEASGLLGRRSLDELAGSALRRQGKAKPLGQRGDGGGVDAEIVQRQRLERLFLRLHDIRQRRVARLVQALLGGEQRRQRQLEGFRVAFGIPLDAGSRTVDVKTRDGSGVGNAETRRKPDRDLAAAGIDGEVASEDDVEGLLGDISLEQGGDARFVGLDALVGDQHRLIGSHRQRRAERFRCPGGADRDDGNRSAVLFPELERFLDRIFIVRIDDIFDAVVRNLAVLDYDPFFRIKGLLQQAENVHLDSPPRMVESLLFFEAMQEKFDGFVDLGGQGELLPGYEPGGNRLIHRSEYKMPGQLDVEIVPERSFSHPFFQNLLNELDVRPYGQADRLAQLQRALPQLDLGHVCEIDVLLQDGVVDLADGAQSFAGSRRILQPGFEPSDQIPEPFLEQGDQDIFLLLEI